MKLFSDLVAHGFALSVAIVTLAMAMEVKPDLTANPLARQPQNQALKEIRQERKTLKPDHKERRAERRERRKERREGKQESKLRG